MRVTQFGVNRYAILFFDADGGILILSFLYEQRLIETRLFSSKQLNILFLGYFFSLMYFLVQLLQRLANQIYYENFYDFLLFLIKFVCAEIRVQENICFSIPIIKPFPF